MIIEFNGIAIFYTFYTILYFKRDILATFHIWFDVIIITCFNGFIRLITLIFGFTVMG